VNVAFRKNDNAFLAVDDVASLQAAADKLSPAIIRKHAIPQIEWCRNVIFKRNLPIHKLFETQL
jgi:hypothetical protein